VERISTGRDVRSALDSKTPAQARVPWGDGEDARSAALARLGNSRPQAAINQRNWISNVVLHLLTGSILRLTGLDSISDEDAISLVGRALFTRFLADRGLLPVAMSGTAGSASVPIRAPTALATEVVATNPQPIIRPHILGRLTPRPCLPFLSPA
jgi:hypothetical protein